MAFSKTSTESRISSAVRFLNTLYIYICTRTFKCLRAESYSQFVPGNTGMKTRSVLLLYVCRHKYSLSYIHQFSITALYLLVILMNTAVCVGYCSSPRNAVPPCSPDTVLNTFSRAPLHAHQSCIQCNLRHLYKPTLVYLYDVADHASNAAVQLIRYLLPVLLQPDHQIPVQTAYLSVPVYHLTGYTQFVTKCHLG